MTVVPLLNRSSGAPRIACLGLLSCLSHAWLGYSSASAQDDAPGVEVVEVVEADEAISLAPPVAVRAGEVGEAKIDLTDDLRPFINVEVGFIKRVCEPTPEQQVQIEAAAGSCLKQLATSLAPHPNRPQQRIVAVTASGHNLSENPVERIQKSMAEAIQPLVSETQYAEYARQSAERARFRRQATVAVVLQILDEHLSLTEDQKERLTARLLEKWTQAETTPIQMYLSNPEYFPPIPEILIQPELAPDQKIIWRSLEKTHFPLYLSQITQFVWEEEIAK